MSSKLVKALGFMTALWLGCNRRLNRSHFASFAREGDFMSLLSMSYGAWVQVARLRKRIAIIVVFAAMVTMGRISFASPNVGGLMGGGGPPVPAPCMADLEREQVQRAITEWKSRHPDAMHSTAVDVPPKFTFYPLGGTLYGDVFTANFVDLDPNPGPNSILDWDCTANTYDGHDATDVILRSFGEELIGVPVFAALDGTVVDAHDGEDDMHTACSGIANYVVLQNAGGRVTYYWHLKRNSVQVSVSQIVRAGEQLGLAASSGCSDWPHLHFATYDNSALVEPYAGPCRPGESEWAEQTPMNHALYLRDLNFTRRRSVRRVRRESRSERSSLQVAASRVILSWPRSSDALSFLRLRRAGAPYIPQGAGVAVCVERSRSSYTT